MFQQTAEPVHEGIGLDLQAALSVQVVRQPGDVKVPAEAQAEILAPQHPHGNRGGEASPRDVRVSFNVLFVVLE